MIKIPFNKPYSSKKELEYIKRCIDTWHISGNGIFTKKCQSFIEKRFNAKKVFLTTSCTHALEVASLLIGLKQGDEVIVPSYTFVSTVNAFCLRGAKPVFIDIRSDTLNIDENKIINKITPRTKAIYVTHYAGIGCEMDIIMKIASKYGLLVVEDAAAGVDAKYRNKYLGTIGHLGAYSFHETKNYSCGEGGALLINDSRFIDKAEMIMEKGTDRSNFFNGLVDKYTWVSLGSSYFPSDILAAFLYAQFKSMDKIHKRRRRIWEYYHRHLSDWARKHHIQLSTVPAHCDQPYHLFYLLLPSSKERKMFIKYLKGKGIMAIFHYLPLHLSAMGKLFGGKIGDCPITKTISERIVRLPFYYDLGVKEQAQIVKAIKKFYEN